MYRYFGRCSDGNYWFIKGRVIYFVKNRKAHIFTTINKVLKSEELLDSLPIEVKNWILEKYRHDLFSSHENNNYFHKNENKSSLPDEKAFILDLLRHLDNAITYLQNLIDTKLNEILHKYHNSGIVKKIVTEISDVINIKVIICNHVIENIQREWELGQDEVNELRKDCINYLIKIVEAYS